MTVAKLPRPHVTPEQHRARRGIEDELAAALREEIRRQQQEEGRKEQ